MSLQDDYFDLQEHLKGSGLESALERIWFAFTDLETAQMVRDGQMSHVSYEEWRAAQVKRLNSGDDNDSN